MLFQFLRSIAKGFKRDKKTNARIDGIRWDMLLWAAREEAGELNGRYHFHVLLSGLPLGRFNQTERFVLKAAWKKAGGGHADVRVFDPALPGVAYVLKGLEQWSRSLANAYEMRKFEARYDREVILAHAFLDKWGKGARSLGTSGRTMPERSGLSLSDRRTRSAKRTKELPAYHGGLYQTNMHPAGISFVR